MMLMSSVSANDYFPLNHFSENEEIDLVVRDRYAKIFGRIGEASLFRESSNLKVEAYRITMIPPFGSPKSILVRINENSLGQIRVSSDKQRKQTVQNRTISAREVQKLRSLVGKSEFWKLPSIDIQERMDVLDGADWVLEIVANGRYHVVSQVSDRKGIVKKVGDQMLRLTQN